MIDGLTEGDLFLGQNCEDTLAAGQNIAGEFGIIFSDDGDDLGEEFLTDAEVEGLQDGAAHEAAEGIALSFVGRYEALRAQKIGTAKMVGDNAHFVGVLIVIFARKLLKLGDNGRHQRDFEDIKAAHGGGGETLESTTEVDVFLLKLSKSTILITLVLHEDLVADFHEACAVRSGMRLAIFCHVLLVFAEIVENLRVGSAGVT